VRSSLKGTVCQETDGGLRKDAAWLQPMFFVSFIVLMLLFDCHTVPGFMNKWRKKTEWWNALLRFVWKLAVKMEVMVIV